MLELIFYLYIQDKFMVYIWSKLLMSSNAILLYFVPWLKFDINDISPLWAFFPPLVYGEWLLIHNFFFLKFFFCRLSTELLKMRGYFPPLICYKVARWNTEQVHIFGASRCLNILATEIWREEIIWITYSFFKRIKIRKYIKVMVETRG